MHILKTYLKFKILKFTKEISAVIAIKALESYVFNVKYLPFKSMNYLFD